MSMRLRVATAGGASHVRTRARLTSLVTDRIALWSADNARMLSGAQLEALENSLENEADHLAAFSGERSDGVNL